MINSHALLPTELCRNRSIIFKIILNLTWHRSYLAGGTLQLLPTRRGLTSVFDMGTGISLVLQTPNYGKLRTRTSDPCVINTVL